MKASLTTSATIVALAFAALLDSPANAQTPAQLPTSGNLLYEICSGNVSEYGSCLGYSVAVNDALNQLAPGKLCERGVTNQQVIDVVIKYLIVNPALRQYPAFDIVTAALYQAFPC